MVIKDYFGLRPTSGDIGIEIEMEGDEPFGNVDKYWRAEDDGSLRGWSREYVLRNPVGYDKVDKVLDYLSKNLKEMGCNINYSFRAGVHIHINVQDLTIYDTYKFGIVYYILEPVLLEWCGPDREANLFCLGLSQANYNVLAMTQELNRGGLGLNAINSDRVRYAALNWTALPKYGSVEFRSLGTKPDFTNIKQWVEILYNIYKASLEYQTADEILKEFSILSPNKWAKKILGDAYEYVKDIPDFVNKIYEGLWEIQDFANAIDNNKKRLVGVDIKDKPVAPKQKAIVPDELFEALNQRIMMGNNIQKPIPNPFRPEHPWVIMDDIQPLRPRNLEEDF